MNEITIYKKKFKVVFKTENWLWVIFEDLEKYEDFKKMLETKKAISFNDENKTTISTFGWYISSAIASDSENFFAFYWKQVEKYFKEFEKDFKEKTWKNFLEKHEEQRLLKKAVLKDKNLLIKVNSRDFEKWERFDEILAKNNLTENNLDFFFEWLKKEWQILNDDEKIKYLVEKEFIKEIF